MPRQHQHLPGQILASAPPRPDLILVPFETGFRYVERPILLNAAAEELPVSRAATPALVRVGRRRENGRHVHPARIVGGGGAGEVGFITRITMTEAEALALSDAWERWGYSLYKTFNKRCWRAPDELFLLVNQELEGVPSRRMVEAHLELSLRYELGVDVPLDLKKALFYLKKAAEVSGAAKMRLITEYRDGGCLVEKDTAEWLRQLQGAADLGIMNALKQLAELKRAGRLARDCTAEELTEIEEHYARAESFYSAGSMYCTDKDSGQCSAEEINKAREWYLKGLDSRTTHPCPNCVAVLKSWGELSSTETVKESVKESMSTTEFMLAPFVLLIWSVIGTALLGVILSINAVTLPLVILLSVAVALYRTFKR